MAFVRSFGNADEAALMLGAGEYEHVILVPLGTDDATGGAYTLTVALSKAPGFAFAERELVFYIQESDEYGGVYHYWDGSATKARIPDPADRAEIMQMVLRALSLLLEELNPQGVVINTYGSDIPERAVTKYLMICAHLVAHGYSVAELQPYAGVRTWVAERLAGAND